MPTGCRSVTKIAFRRIGLGGNGAKPHTWVEVALRCDSQMNSVDPIISASEKVN